MKRIMVDSISYDIPDYDYPLVILLAGVNGVGKRRQSANLQTISNQSGKASLWLPRTRSGRRRPINLKCGRIARTSELSNIRKAAIPRALCLTRFRRQKPGATTLFSLIPQDVFTTRKPYGRTQKIHKVIIRELPNADYRSYIVLDATTGQNALSQVEIFSEAIDIDGIILTKLDGTAKGGVVMAISAEQEIPVVFVGVGEKSTTFFRSIPKNLSTLFLKTDDKRLTI